MKEYKKVDTNNITVHYDEGVDEKTTVIRAIEYEGELWYNAKDIENHLMSLMGDMVSIKGCAEQLTNELKERLQDER
jgi:hypothetical protein